MLTAFASALDSGKLRIYDNTAAVPTNADDSIGANVQLAELTLAATAETSITNGVLTFAAITADSSADATGTATFFRLWDSAGTTCYFQGTVAAATADLVLNAVAIAAGAAVSVSSLVLTLARE